MLRLLLVLLPFFFQEALPLKPKEEFEVRLNYEFRQRVQQTNGNTYDFTSGNAERVKSSSSGPLPYLSVNVRLIRLPNQEVRLKGITSKNDIFITKKIAEGDVVKFDLGFTDDLKDHVAANEYNLLFLTKDKNEINRIQFLVERNGTFKINGEVRGKF